MESISFVVEVIGFASEHVTFIVRDLQGRPVYVADGLQSASEFINSQLLKAAATVKSKSADA